MVLEQQVQRSLMARDSSDGVKLLKDLVDCTTWDRFQMNHLISLVNVYIHAEAQWSFQNYTK